MDQKGARVLELSYTRIVATIRNDYKNSGKQFLLISWRMYNSGKRNSNASYRGASLLTLPEQYHSDTV